MQKVAGKQGDHNVSEAGRREHVAQIGPGEGRKIRGKKTGEADDAKQNPRLSQSPNQRKRMVQIYWADLNHATSQQHVTRAAETYNG